MRAKPAYAIAALRRTENTRAGRDEIHVEPDDMPRLLAAADLSCDGRADAVVTRSVGGDWIVLMKVGTGEAPLNLLSLELRYG